tara:strand:- start:331 stop:630 length:300 start_codon:yes stop_codon:yes gene_type:complete
MWIKLKNRIINLHHIYHIRWYEEGNKVWLFLYSNSNDDIQMSWSMVSEAKEINIAVDTISKVTNTPKIIFKHQLANNALEKNIDELNRSTNPNAEFIGE